jgi:hypothetical protein
MLFWVHWKGPLLLVPVMISVVERIAQAHPGALSAANNIGQLLLHLTCVNHTTVDVLRFLIQHNKAAVGAHYQA